MLENGMVVYHKGEATSLDLEESQAESLSYFADAARDVPAREADRSPATMEQRKARIMARCQVASEFGMLLDRFSRLKEHGSRELARVIAYLDLVEFGDGNLTGANWVHEIISTLLDYVDFDGPAVVNERNPREALASMAHDIATFWDWIDDAKLMRERHGAVLQPSEPPAKAQRARKPPKTAA